MAFRWLGHSAQSGADQMAIDEALLLSGGVPTLRTYCFEPATLSLGATQMGRQDLSPLFALQVPIVRRLTGGGAILHAHDLTYSITIAEDHPYLQGCSREDSYHRLHEPIIRWLLALSLPVERGSAEIAAPSRQQEALLCFGRATRLDLLLHGKKLVGSAQRRRGGRILQHGSIVLRPHPLQPNTASLVDALEPLPPTRDLSAGLALHFAEVFGAPTADDLSQEERAHAIGRAPDFVLRRAT